MYTSNSGTFDRLALPRHTRTFNHPVLASDVGHSQHQLVQSLIFEVDH